MIDWDNLDSQVKLLYSAADIARDILRKILMVDNTPTQLGYDLLQFLDQTLQPFDLAYDTVYHPREAFEEFITNLDIDTSDDT
jgi:hypothetical protein